MRTATSPAKGWRSARAAAFLTVLALVFAACGFGEAEIAADSRASSSSSTGGRQGDGSESAEARSERAGPVVDLFYAIHVHADSEWSPFLGPDLAELDAVAAQGYVDQVEAIAGILERHGARGSFHFTFGTAAGLCRYRPGYFEDLESRGHEIGIHAHANAFLLKAADAMRDDCGRDVTTGSGLEAMAGGPDAATDRSLATSLGVFVDVGVNQLLVNLGEQCGGVSDGGNIVVPWRAREGDVCETDPGGAAVLIDQVSLAAVVDDGGSPADVFSDDEFSKFGDLAEAAVAAAASMDPQEIAVWGFVTHTNEYVRGSSPLAPVEQQALDGLDVLLDRLDMLVQAGTARWSTAEEIGMRVTG